MSDSDTIQAVDDIVEPGTEPLDPISREGVEFVEAPALKATMSAIGNANAEELEANLSAIASAKTGMLTTMASAVALSQVEGDATFKLSSAPIVYTKGNAALQWSYSSAFVAGGTVNMDKSGAVAVAGREVHIDMGGSAVVAAGKARVEKGLVGVLLSGKTELGDGARVLIDTKAAFILAIALLGGFGLLAVAIYYSARRLSTWRPTWPDLSTLQLPPLSQFIRK